MKKRSYLNMTRGFAIYDIVALAPFALPFLASTQLDMFGRVHEALGLWGVPISAVNPNEMVFLNMLGILGVAWSIWRLRNVTVRLGVFEGWVRAAFAAVLLYAGLFNDGSAILILFGLIDVIAAPLHWLGYRVKV